MVADRHRLAAYHNAAYRTADELFGGTNIDDLERPWTPKIWVLTDFFCYFRLRRTLKSEFSLKYTGDRPRQPAYEIKLMLSRVSWALAQISCSVRCWRLVSFIVIALSCSLPLLMFPCQRLLWSVSNWMNWMQLLEQCGSEVIYKWESVKSVVFHIDRLNVTHVIMMRKINFCHRLHPCVKKLYFVWCFM